MEHVVSIRKSPAKVIKTKSSEVLESYQFTQNRNCNWASSLTKLAHATAQEYEDRFLIELIQNGYDVHNSSQRDGQIWMHFARDEGEFGTLYVANGGRPFTESNFHAICEIAQSDKEPGAGIGNKGVGFKSVLHVCDTPEIYSVTPDTQDASNFDGFCFRFAKDDDYADLANGDDALLKSLKRDVSPYFLPVHISHVPESIARFATADMVSVIRLPLSRKSASAATSGQLEELRASSVPVLLFLPRLGRLVIEESNGGEVVTKTEIRRQQDPIVGQDSDLECRWSRVTISRTDRDDEGEHPANPRRFFHATKAVDRGRLQEAIASSIEQGYLDERFAEWTEEAEVSAAVEYATDTPSDCRLYTFLPMGDEARCPFGGHLNAPFAPNLSRTRANPEIPLNGLFFDIAAELVAESAIAIADNPCDEIESVLIDLISWDATYAPRLVAAFEARGKSLDGHPLLQLVPVKDLSCRGSIDDVYTWANECRVFKSEEIRRITLAPLLAPVKGVNRQGRLAALVKTLNCTLDPDEEQLADWAEKVAKDLATKSFKAQSWNDFYSDIAAIFADRGSALAGRQILLDSSGALRQAGPFRGAVTSADRPAVFFPPTTERSEDDEDISMTAGVAIPDNLLRYMCYLHDELTWYERDGAVQRRTPARDFLQKAQLVQRFDTRSLIEHCSRILENTKAVKVRGSALHLAFSLQHAARSTEALELDRLPFHVPTKDGWRPASDALFSQQWPNTQGAQLVILIANARTVSDDIASLDDRLLLDPSAEPFKDGSTDEWKTFLTRIGVKDGLWPQEMSLSASDFRGDDVTKAHIGHALKMSDDAIAQWGLTHLSSQLADYPYTQYRVQSPFYRLPGQFEYSQLTNQAKHTYARLVFSQAGKWDTEHFISTIERPRSSGKDTLSWPTPLNAFLRFEEWVPVREDATSETYVAPSNAWLFDESDGSIAPSFLPLLPRDLRRQLEGGGPAYERLVECGPLRLVGREKDAPALVVLLGDLIAADQIGEANAGSFRRLYANSWQQMLSADAQQRTVFTNAKELHLAITRGSDPIPLKIRNEGEPCCEEVLYVVDSEEKLRRQLLSDLRFPTLDVGPRIGAKAVDLLKPTVGDKIRASSSVDIEVQVDGGSVTPGQALSRLLDDSNEWIKSLLALVVQLKGRVPSHHTAQAQSQVQKRLFALRAVSGSQVSLSVDQSEAELPRYFHDVVLINDAEYPTIAFASNSEAWTWDMFERLAPAIASAVDRGSIQADLEVAIHRLARSAVDEYAQEPTEDELAEALATSVDEVSALLREWRSHELSILEFLFPVVYHLCGSERAATFDPTRSSFLSKDDIRTALLGDQDALPIGVDELLEKCGETATMWVLRDELGIDYGDFNATLRAIGHPYKPARNEDGHRNEFVYFKQVHIEAMRKCLRAKFLDEYREGASLQQYVDVRDLTTLQADPEWLDKCDLPSDTMMRGQANSWLRDLGSTTLDDPAPELTDLQATRTENRRLIRRLADQLWTVVPVWCSKNKVATPIAWNQIDVADKIADAMLNLGLTDFEQLASKKVFQWLADNNHLPPGMPHSTDHKTLGLSAEDLSKSESEAEKQKREKDYERCTIEIDGNRYGSTRAECESLIEAVRSSISDTFLKSSASVSNLGVVGRKKKPKRKKNGGGSGGDPEGRMTDAQKHATGFVGELLAFEWLKDHYDGVTDKCWKSKYRDLVFGGNLGDDGLGYDFEVFLKNTSYMFEVKATTGSDCVIELGATELETSQGFARSNRYRILFVSNVLDVNRRKVYVLPNPFSKKGRGLFQASGTGIKFRFLME